MQIGRFPSTIALRSKKVLKPSATKL